MDESSTLPEIQEIRVTANGRRLPEAPMEPAMTGRVRRGLQGAKAGKQVDARLNKLGIGWETFLQPKRRGFGRDEGTLDVIRAIRDLDPMASQAVWNYLRLLNPGHDLVAYTGEGTKEKPESGEAQAYLDELAARVGQEYGGGLDQLHNVLALSLLTSGAIASEVAPTDGLDDVDDWYVIDPIRLTFKRNPDTGHLDIGQLHEDGHFEALPPAQVFYQPLDPEVGDPYGRPPMVAAVQAVMSRAMMINDIRAVAHQAGYPRIDVEVMWEAVEKAAPPQLREPGREADFTDWSQKQLQAIVSDYSALQVDDTWVHYDWVKPGLTETGGLSFDFPALDDVLQRQLNSALKMLPVLLGINEGVSETHGSVQWQIQIAGVQSMQRVIKRLIEKMANASLQLAGFNVHAKIEYDDTRSVDRLYEAQAELFEGQNLQLDVQNGWRSNDEAAELRTGHKAVKEPKPPPAPATTPPTTPGGTGGEGDQGGQNPTPTEKQQQQVQAWNLLWSQWNSSAAVGMRAQFSGQDPNTLHGDHLDKIAEALGSKADELFIREIQHLVETLNGEGLDIRIPAGEIADSAFGLGYRREMKKLLREAIARGMLEGGLDATETVPERLVRSIWKENDQFIRKIRDDLASQVRLWSAASKTDHPATVGDVRAWFEQNRYREQLMGKFLAKQGIASGFTHGRQVICDRVSPGVDLVYRWVLGPVATEHCGSCLARAGQTYSASQLAALGHPGSIQLDCGANCQCSIVATACGGASAPTTRVVAWLGGESSTQAQACSIAATDRESVPYDAKEELKRKVLEDAGKTEWDPADWEGLSWDEMYESMGFEDDIAGLTRTQLLNNAGPESGRTSAINHWQSEDYRDINGLLYGQPLEDPDAAHIYADWITDLDRSIGLQSLKRDAILWRGVDAKEAFGGADLYQYIGQEFRNDGFLATSTIRGGGQVYTNLDLEIHVAAGTPALNVSQAVQRYGEQEILFGRGAVLRLDGIDRDRNLLRCTLVRVEPPGKVPAPVIGPEAASKVKIKDILSNEKGYVAQITDPDGSVEFHVWSHDQETHLVAKTLEEATALWEGL